MIILIVKDGNELKLNFKSLRVIEVGRQLRTLIDFKSELNGKLMEPLCYVQLVFDPKTTFDNGERWTIDGGPHSYEGFWECESEVEMLDFYLSKCNNATEILKEFKQEIAPQLEKYFNKEKFKSLRLPFLYL
jgi:hypothetical protein